MKRNNVKKVLYASVWTLPLLFAPAVTFAAQDLVTLKCTAQSIAFNSVSSKDVPSGSVFVFTIDRENKKYLQYSKSPDRLSDWQDIYSVSKQYYVLSGDDGSSDEIRASVRIDRFNSIFEKEAHRKGNGKPYTFSISGPCEITNTHLKPPVPKF